MPGALERRGEEAETMSGHVMRQGWRTQSPAKDRPGPQHPEGAEWAPPPRSPQRVSDPTEACISDFQLPKLGEGPCVV